MRQEQMKIQTMPILLVLHISLILYTIASADIIDTYGFGAKNMAKGAAVCASVKDGSSVFYNPAGLGKISGFDSGVSYFRTFSAMKISGTLLSAPAPDNSDLSFGAIQFDIALNLDLLADMDRNVTFGLGVVTLDDGSVAFLEDVEESTYSYVQFGSTLKRVTIYMGLGMEILEKKLWAGIGAHAMIKGSAAASLTLDASNLSSEKDVIPDREEIWMEMDVSLKPMLGLIYKINKKLTFGFSYKDEIVADIDDFKANLDINLGTNGYPIPTLLAIMASWSPSVYRAGISYQTRYAEIELDIFREQWSRFNRGFIRDLRRVAPDFDDVCSFHLGYSFKINEGMNLFAGYVYAPTPVPEQPDTSNYLGSNRHIISCGGEKMIERPLGKIRFPIWLGLSLQNQLVEDRTFTKSDGSQYKVNGNIFSVLCSVRIFYDRT